jgi:SAM-dependent methyltransferase
MEHAQTTRLPIELKTEVSNEEKAFLLNGTKKIPIYAGYASKYSLAFRYLEDQDFSASDEHVNLLIRNKDDSVELGPCRILPGPYQDPCEGRLVFLHNVYDFERLFKDKKVINLQSVFHELPAILARKNEIHQSFQKYTADLSYDLNAYKKIFDDLDSQYIDEPEDVRQAIQKAIIDTQENAFKRFLDKKLEELEHAVEDFSLEEHQTHGFYFRKQLWNFILCCPIFARTNLKPRGYPGDSEMMRMLYDNDYRGDTTFAKIFHKHGVEHPASQSVRNRIRLIADLLAKVQSNAGFEKQKKIKVLSVGAGPAFELRNVLKSPQECDKYHFALLDQDATALSEAADLIREIESKFNRKVKVDYLKYSVRKMLFARELKEKLGQFHFIYSMGLFDYLAAPVAKAVLKRLYQLLKPGGKMVIGNFHVSNPSKYYMEYWCDWVLYHRTEEEFLDMLKEESSADASVFFEDTGSQMFLHVEKRRDTLKE